LPIQRVSPTPCRCGALIGKAIGEQIGALKDFEKSHMSNLVISVFGTDRPGIVASVSKVFFDSGCDVRDVSQTTLQTEFAGIFVVTPPAGLDPADIEERIKKEIVSFGLDVFVKPMGQLEEVTHPKGGEPFVITAMGPDRLGLVAGLTQIIAGFGVNIVNLKAIFRGGNDPRRNIMIYEVDIPCNLDLTDFRDALARRAVELKLDLSIQHRDIFEEINRI